MVKDPDAKRFVVEFAILTEDIDSYYNDVNYQFSVTCKPEELVTAAMEVFRTKYGLMTRGEHHVGWYREHPQLTFHRVYERRDLECPELGEALVAAYKEGKKISGRRAAAYRRAEAQSAETRQRELAELQRLKNKYPDEGTPSHEG